MVSSLASICLSSNTILPLRIFINRKQLFQNNSSTTIFQTPLLSNNSLISLKSPTTRIYLSNHDMRDLCTELMDDLLFIIYELTSPMVSKNVLGKLRIGQSVDFKENVINKLFSKDDHNEGEQDIFNSHISTITKISKIKYKIRFAFHWEVDIFINNTTKLSKIRQYLLFKDRMPTVRRSLGLYSRRKVLLKESTSSGKKSHILIEDESDNDVSNKNTTDSSDLEIIENESLEAKPEIVFNYKPVMNFGECIDIHVLQRPRRHHKSRN